MEKFIFASPNGEQIEIGYNDTYILESYDGVSETGIEPIYHNGYNQQGVFIDNVRYAPRYIKLYFWVFTPTMEETYEQRAKLNRIFNPLNGEGELTYINDYTSKSIKALTTVALTPIERLGNLTQYNIELMCANPFWYDTAENALKLEGFVGGLTYPLVFSGSGVQFATTGNVARIENKGTVSAPVRVEFIGAAATPKLILNETGEFIQVDTSLVSGQKLTINTEYGKKSVELTNGTTTTSAFHYLNIGSTFFNLPTGTSNVQFTVASGNPDVYIHWRNYYNGI